MTQYRLKLLTILANFLTTQLLSFNAEATTAFVRVLVSHLDQCQQASKSPDAAHFEIRGCIPEAPLGTERVEELVLPYGFSLLQEITFNFIVYCAADVQSNTLRLALLSEFRSILHSLISSSLVFEQSLDLTRRGDHIDERSLQDYMLLKRKRMNQNMMVLADCIALEEPLPQGMLEYFNHMSEVCELRAVAFKDLQGASQAQDASALQNNLFYFWLLHKEGV